MTRILVGRSNTRELSPDVETYAAELVSYLRGPARLKTRVVEEITADLETAERKFTARGLGARDAVKAAVAEMGSAKIVASGFADELAIAEARRVLRWLLATGPMVGVWWLLLLAPAGWTTHPDQLLNAIPILPVIAAAVVAGLLILATTGSLIRWLPETSSRRAVFAAALVGFACIAGDVLVLTTLAVRLASGSASFTAGVAVVAVLASLTRLPFAIYATSRCLRTRRLLRATPPMTR